MSPTYRRHKQKIPLKISLRNDISLISTIYTERSAFIEIKIVPSLHPEIERCLCLLGGADGCFGVSSIYGISGSSRLRVKAPDIGIVRLAVITIGDDRLLGSLGSSLEPLSTLLLRPSPFLRLPGRLGLLGLGPISPPTPAVWWRHCSLVQTFFAVWAVDTLSSMQKFSVSLHGSPSSHCLKKTKFINLRIREIDDDDITKKIVISSDPGSLLFGTSRQSKIEVSRMSVHHMKIKLVNESCRNGEKSRGVLEQCANNVYHVYTFLSTFGRNFRSCLTRLHAVKNVGGENLSSK